MSRIAWLRLLAVLAVAALAALVVHRTEWVEDDVERPARGAAAEDPNYALAHLVQGLGARFEHHTDLERLPPPGATLVLETTFWDLFPERRAALRQWVEAGGHLVVPTRATFGEALGAWLPLRAGHAPARHAGAASRPTAKAAGGQGDASDDEEEDDDDDTDGAASATAPRRRTSPPPRCETLAEVAGAGTAMPGRLAYQACGPYDALPLHARRGVAPDWSLRRGDGTLVALRMPVGRGTVTASELLDRDSNEALARDDNAALVAALLRLRPGQVVWDVDDESRPVLAAWLWQQARPAILLAAIALAAWLWRRATRFGPRVAEPETARRSIGEQVAGVAAFLRHHEPAALHRAARRALEDLARRHLAGFEEEDEGGRVRLIADAARLDAAGLRDALRPGPLSAPPQWLAAAATLEHARRALRDAVRPASRPAR